VEQNILRVKGQQYFENHEITGSKRTDSKGNKKFPIADWIRDTLMPALKALCQRIEHQTGKRVHVRGQWDNASPHTEIGVLRLIASLFESLGWVWTMQPSNSPLTNVCDAAFFPAMAKDVSALQGILYGGRYMKEERLWEAVLRAWDEYPCEKVARSFVHHSQVAAAILDCKGGDEFVKEKNGLSFNVRKVCTLFYDEGKSLYQLSSLALQAFSHIVCSCSFSFDRCGGGSNRLGRFGRC
jgi:hypothetical protein